MECPQISTGNSDSVVASVSISIIESSLRIDCICAFIVTANTRRETAKSKRALPPLRINKLAGPSDRVGGRARKACGKLASNRHPIYLLLLS